MGRPFLWDAPRGAPLAANPGGGAGPPPRPPRRDRSPDPAPPAAPIRPCSRWGLPCRPRRRGRGALLPHPFTLARRVRPRPFGRGQGRAVCFLWHFPWGRPRRPLAGTVVPVEPGLSSSPGANRGQRPSSRLARQRYVRAGAPASMPRESAPPPCSAATSASRRSVPASAAPSTRSGRQRRWNAVSRAVSGRSVR